MKKFLVLILSVITALCAVFFIACNYEGTEIDFLNWLNNGETAVEPENPEKPDEPQEPENPSESVYGTYKFYSAEEDGKIWYVGDEIDGHKITEDFCTFILGPDDIYVFDDGVFLNSLYIISITCITEGVEYAFYLEGEKVMDITVTEGYLVGINTNPSHEKIVWKKVSNDYIMPESPQENTALSKINKDTDFEALESDKVTEEELFNAIIEIEEILYCYDFKINVTLDGVRIDSEGEIYTGYIKRDGLYVLNGNNPQKPEYIVISEDLKSYISNGKTYETEENRIRFAGEEYKSAIRQSLEYISYNDTSKRYEGFELDNETEFCFIIKDGHIVYYHEEVNGESMTLKLYDWGTTKVIRSR